LSSSGFRYVPKPASRVTSLQSARHETRGVDLLNQVPSGRMHLELSGSARQPLLIGLRTRTKPSMNSMSYNRHCLSRMSTSLVVTNDINSRQPLPTSYHCLSYVISQAVGLAFSPSGCSLTVLQLLLRVCLSLLSLVCQPKLIFR